MTAVTRGHGPITGADDGSLIAELAVAIPICIVGLVMVVNIIGFTAECARFDRVAGEVARSVVLSEVDSDADLTAKLTACLGYEQGPHEAFASAQSGAGLQAITDYRTVVCTLEYRPWPSPGFSIFRGTPMEFTVESEPWTHKQAFVFDRFMPGVIF